MTMRQPSTGLTAQASSTTVENLGLQSLVASACRILAMEGYADLTLGHVSARVPGHSVAYIKRKGLALDEVKPDDVIPLDLHAGDAYESPDMHLEAALHTEVYRARPDVAAVIHGHPPYATALGASDAKLELLTHDAVLFTEGVSVFDETPELIQASGEASAVAASLGPRLVVIMRNHGVLVVGKSIAWAVLAAVTLERAVRMQVIASSLGNLRAMSAAAAESLNPTKYSDSLVDEYWEAWVRKIQRFDFAGGKPPT